MYKKQAQYYFSLLVCGFMIIGSMMILIKDGFVELSEQKTLTGRVVDSGISYYSTGGRYKTKKRVFYARLENSEYKFAIYRDYQGYDDLQRIVKIGDSLKIYYRSSGEVLNRNVIQMEKDKQILFGVKEYKNRAQTIAALVLMIGIGITVVVTFSYHKINLGRVLLRLVE